MRHLSCLGSLSAASWRGQDVSTEMSFLDEMFRHAEFLWSCFLCWMIFSFNKNHLETWRKLVLPGLLLWAGQRDLDALMHQPFGNAGGHKAEFFWPRQPRYMVNVQHNLCYKTWRQKMPNVWRTGTSQGKLGRNLWSPYPNQTKNRFYITCTIFWRIMWASKFPKREMIQMFSWNSVCRFFLAGRGWEKTEESQWAWHWQVFSA